MTANRTAVDRALRCWNAGDLDGYLELYDATIALHGYTPEPMGKAAVTDFYRGIFASFHQPQLAFDDVIESGDRIVVRFTMTGRHAGEFMGVPETGREIALPGITILRFAGDTGLVVERWSSADMLGLLVQIGAMPAPA